MTASGIRLPQAALVAVALAAGLAVDARSGFAGQAAIGLVFWALLSWLLGRVSAEERRALMACVVIATAGEMFLSLGWGLYTYRLGNVPLFVPPGHALMLMLGFSLTRQMPEKAARAILGGAGIYTLLAAATGLDTLAVPLYLMLAVSVLSLPAHTRLFASSFVLTLTLELYGTALGNWYWDRQVPWVSLVTTNPPAIAGAFYCALDALVAVASLLVSNGFRQPLPQGGEAR